MATRSLRLEMERGLDPTELGTASIPYSPVKTRRRGRKMRNAPVSKIHLREVSASKSIFMQHIHDHVGPPITGGGYVSSSPINNVVAAARKHLEDSDHFTRMASKRSPAYHPSPRKKEVSNKVDTNRMQGSSIKDWLATQEHEREAFSSAALEAEAKFQRAAVFGKNLPKPNMFATAVAFDVLDSMGSAFASHAKIFRNIRNALRDGVYVDPAEVKRQLKAWDPEDGTDRLEVYYGSPSHFQKQADLMRENERLRQQLREKQSEISELKMRHQEQIRAHVLQNEAVVQKHHDEAKEAADDLRKELKEAQTAIKTLQDDKDRSDLKEEIIKMLMRVHMGDREQVVLDCLEQAPSTWVTVTKQLLRNMPIGTTIMAVVSSLNARPGLRHEDYVEIIMGLMDGEGVARTKGTRGRLLAALVAGADGDRPAVMDAAMSTMKSRERLATVRFMCGLDKTIDWNYVGRLIHHSGITSVDTIMTLQTRTGNAAAMAASPFVSILSSLHKEEQTRLVDVIYQQLTADQVFDLSMGQGVEYYKTFSEDRKEELFLSLMTHLSDETKARLFPSTAAAKIVDEDGEFDDESTFAEPNQKSKNIRVRRRRRRKKIRMPVPFAKYMRKIPRHVSRPELTEQMIFDLIYECIERKIAADDADDKAGSFRQSLPESFRDFMLHKFGLPSVVDGYLYTVVEWLKNAKKDHNMRRTMFAVMLGVIDEEKWAPRYADTVLHMYKVLFPHFSASTLRLRQPGVCIVHLDSALEALDACFPYDPQTFSIDKLYLTNGRRKKMEMETMALTMKFNEFMSGIKDVSASLDADASKGLSNLMGQFRSEDNVIDVDHLLHHVMSYWSLQVEADAVSMKAKYYEFDDDQNGVLSFSEFTTLLGACCPDKLSQRRITELFRELCAIDGVGSGDSVSAEAFSLFCNKYGITSHSADEGVADVSEAAAAETETTMS